MPTIPSSTKSGPSTSTTNSRPRISATSEWVRILQILLSGGCPRIKTRGRVVHEILAGQTRISMAHPVVQVEARKLGYKFQAAEAHWILTGDNRLSTILPFSRGIGAFSDDGSRFDGAYGPKIIDQLRYVVDSLLKDSATRQAIIDIWRPNPRDSSDIPCTLSLQFLIRDGHLNTIATMRSSDIWLGWPYDVFTFTMVSSMIVLEISRRSQIQVPLGDLFVRPGSLHLYEDNIEEARVIAWEDMQRPIPAVWTPHTYDHMETLISDLGWAKETPRGTFALRGLQS